MEIGNYPPFSPGRMLNFQIIVKIIFRSLNHSLKNVWFNSGDFFNIVRKKKIDCVWFNVQKCIHISASQVFCSYSDVIGAYLWGEIETDE